MRWHRPDSVVCTEGRDVPLVWLWWGRMGVRRIRND